METSESLFQAEALYDQGRLVEALSLVSDARLAGIRDSEIERVAACTLFRLGRFDEAFRAAKAAQEIDPQNWRAHLCYAETLERLGLLKQALSAARSPLIPSWGADMVRANVAFDRGKFAETARCCESALETFPDDEDLVWLALAARWLGRNDEDARSRLESFFYEDGRVHTGPRLAWCLEQKNLLGEASRILYRCSQVPERPYFVELLSFLNRHKRFKEARELLDSLTAWQRALPGARLHEAFTLLAEGKKRLAATHAVSLFQDNPMDEQYAGAAIKLLFRSGKVWAAYRVARSHVGELTKFGL